MSIKDKIISTIKSNIYNKLLGNNKSKIAIWVKKFKEILYKSDLDTNVIDSLCKTYTSNLDAVTLNGKNDSDENADSIMHLTLYSYCESITNEKTLSYKKLVVLGNSGCGKTSFICSYIKKNKLTKIFYASDNQESIDLIRTNSYSYLEVDDYTELTGNMRDSVIFETSSVKKTLEFLSKESSARVILIIDSQITLGALYGLKMNLEQLENKFNRIEGVIISKKDFIGSVSALLSINSILNLKLLGLTQYEITDKKRDICSPYDIMELVSLKVFNRNEGIEDVRSILSKNSDLINLKTYRVYVSFMLSIDADKYEKVFNMFNFAIKKLNIDTDTYKKLIDKLKNEKQNGELIGGLKKHLIIIDSMRESEKLDYSIIDIKRAKRIALGCGVSVGEVFNMLNKFEQTKKVIKFANYSKLFEDK